MSRSKQGSLMCQAFAEVHRQTLAGLHSIVETSKHQSEASDISASEGCPPPNPTPALTSLSEPAGLASIYSTFIQEKGGKQTSQQSAARHLETLWTDRRSNTKESVFPKSACEESYLSWLHKNEWSDLTSRNLVELDLSRAVIMPMLASPTFQKIMRIIWPFISSTHIF